MGKIVLASAAHILKIEYMNKHLTEGETHTGSN